MTKFFDKKIKIEQETKKSGERNKKFRENYLSLQIGR